MSDGRSRPPFHRSTRMRFAAATAGLVAGGGALILVVVYASMRFLTEYRIPTLSAVPDGEVRDPADASGSITLATAKPVTGLPTGIVVSSGSDVLNTLLIYSACALVILTLVGAVASWFLAGRMLRPLQSLSAAAELASRGSLSHRVGTTGRHDEFDAVSQTFDDMLAELERSFDASQRFAANASHEIRTPLATTKALLEVAATEDNSPRVTLLLRRLTESNDRLIDITEALLDLATIGQEQPVRDTVDLRELVSRELEAIADEVSQRGLRLSVRIGAETACGSDGLLRLLIGNLIRNAVRHNHVAGDLAIETTRADGGRVRVIVENSGDRIPEHSLARLIEPFYRERGRAVLSEGAPGHGLGLAIAGAVVNAHGGTLELEALDEGGLRVTVELPGACVPLGGAHADDRGAAFSR
ncbi:HAMP domain-containing sensor histidine kinase [Leifsonia sp. 71-9]|uniref:sensor histidine kinase n=1 Tax=Leifsonia sp. 71-9 TaxID=1895934 RepID=UPI0025BC4083|nr:HAMP domain-containing sensor histidine kinase [Leifsonia sp. 71-9]